jgi:hypothetical protein
MNKVILCILLCCISYCGDVDDAIKEDIKAFDTFIGLPYDDFIIILGTQGNYYELYTDNTSEFTLTYKKYYFSATGFNRHIEIQSSSHGMLKIFNYYTSVCFKFKNSYCTSWSAN